MKRPLLLLAALLPLSAAAQSPPVVWIDPGAGVTQAVALREMAVDIRIHGFVASTFVDLVFHNPNDRVLEGELVFPLADGQTITGYALEVDGMLREGVVVPKQTARVAFEAITRRGIDPGLAELTRGNVFRTRLYPIPARGDKRVRVAFDQPLLRRADGHRYILPLQFEQPLGRLRIRAEAVQVAARPIAQGAPDALAFDRWQQSWVAELDRSNVIPRRELSIDVPTGSEPRLTYTTPDEAAPDWRWFITQLDTGRPAQLATLPAPRRIVLFYDASGSARARDRRRELDALSAWWATLDDAEIDLIAFRDAADTPRRFRILRGDGAALRAAIEKLPLDGGTSHAALRLDPTRGHDLAVLVGDGLSNFGGDEPQLLRSGARTPRLLILHAAQSVDSLRLQRLARQHGGEVVDLLRTDAAAWVARTRAARWQLTALETLAGECTDLSVETPQPVDATLDVSGRCRGPAVLRARFEGAGRRIERQFALDGGAALPAAHGDAVRRLAATALIRRLEADPRNDAARIIELATRHAVVTQHTSLLVLDRIEDYVQYRVAPREPSLRTQYEALLARQPQVPDPEWARAAHLERVAADWEAFRTWHGTDHPGLETLVLEQAAAELEYWRAARAPRNRLADVEAVQDRAQALLKRRAAGTDADSAKAWRREASGLLRELATLREQRPPMPVGAAGLRDAERSRANDPRPAQAPAASIAPDAAAESVSDAAPPPRALDSVAGALEAKRVGEADGATSTTASIALAAWDPSTPWLAALRAAEDPYAAYLAQRELHATTPSFYLDCADFFRNEARQPAIGLRVLSNLAEIDLESAPLLRVLAYRLQQWQRFDLAVPLLDQVRVLRGEEPQSHRDLALALSRRPQPDFARSAALLWEVVAREWDGRFPEVQVIALHELGDLVARAAAASPAVDLRPVLDSLGVEARFRTSVPVGLRVVLTWDADNTDVDLWVTDPLGETAIYSHPRTRTGGHMSRDFTGGYGPEVFTIAEALPGTYRVEAHYFGDRVQKMTGAATLQVEFLTAFGSGASARQAATRRLEGDGDRIELGSFSVD